MMTAAHARPSATTTPRSRRAQGDRPPRAPAAQPREPRRRDHELAREHAAEVRRPQPAVRPRLQGRRRRPATSATLTRRTCAACATACRRAARSPGGGPASTPAACSGCRPRRTSSAAPTCREPAGRPRAAPGAGLGRPSASRRRPPRQRRATHARVRSSATRATPARSPPPTTRPREQIIRVEADLYVDPDPAKRPRAAELHDLGDPAQPEPRADRRVQLHRHEPARLHAAAQRLRLRGPGEQAADLQLVPRRRALPATCRTASSSRSTVADRRAHLPARGLGSGRPRRRRRHREGNHRMTR